MFPWPETIQMQNCHGATTIFPLFAMIHARCGAWKHPCHLCSSDPGIRKRPRLIQHRNAQLTCESGDAGWIWDLACAHRIIDNDKWGFSKWRYPQVIHFRLGFSITIQLLGYPHDYGNPQMALNGNRQTTSGSLFGATPIRRPTTSLLPEQLRAK